MRFPSSVCYRDLRLSVCPACVYVLILILRDFIMAPWQWKKMLPVMWVLPVCPWRLRGCVCGTVCCSCTPWGRWGHCRSLPHGCQHRKREEWLIYSYSKSNSYHQSEIVEYFSKGFQQSWCHVGFTSRMLFNSPFSNSKKWPLNHAHRLKSRFPHGQLTYAPCQILKFWVGSWLN